MVGIIYHLSGLEGVISRLYICDDFKKVSKIRLLLLCLWLLGGRVQAAASCAIMKGNGSLHWVGAVNIDTAIAGRATLFEESSEVKVICLLKHSLEKKTRLMRFCLNDCMQHGLDILQKFVALEIVLQKAWVCNCPDCEVSCSEELPWTLSTKGVSSDHCEYWSQNGKITAATGTCTDSLNVASTLVSNWLRRQSHLLSLVMAVESFMQADSFSAGPPGWTVQRASHDSRTLMCSSAITLTQDVVFPPLSKASLYLAQKGSKRKGPTQLSMHTKNLARTESSRNNSSSGTGLLFLSQLSLYLTSLASPSHAQPCPWGAKNWTWQQFQQTWKNTVKMMHKIALKSMISSFELKPSISMQHA